MYSDEKVFTVDQVSSSRTDRYISKLPASDVPHNVRFVSKTKHPASVMVFGLVTADGKKMPPVFIPNGIKINTTEYIKILEKNVFSATNLLLYLNCPQNNSVLKKTEKNG